MNRRVMDRIIDTIEWIAAMFVGLVAADIFLSVFLRRFFSLQIPDSYDFGRMLLGILIFWGIAATSYRGGHITVDLVWASASPRWRYGNARFGSPRSAYRFPSSPSAWTKYSRFPRRSWMASAFSCNATARSNWPSR